MTATLSCSCYSGHRYPTAVISHAVWLYFRFPPSLRMVEEMLAARGILVSHETARQWGLKFGQAGHDHRQAGQLWCGEAGDHARGRASAAQGPEQPGGEQSPADPKARTDHEAFQVGW